MIKLDLKYSRQDFIDFLQENFLQDYVRDVRPVSTNGQAIQKATSLGRSEILDLQVFEFEYSGSASKRVALTKEAFRIMKQSATFNALAVFYGQNSDDWRLSFLTANPEKTEKGKITVAYSNPRRYSFFLGPNAKINTPNRFLIKDGHVKGYDDLLSRFNVEIVTKEFFENYKKLFDRLLAYLNKDHDFQDFADRNGVETTNFAKKLLGQIVFIYFLQRKGWLGANKGDSISSGDKDFLRSLFKKCVENKKNFYNDYLEKLFYGALNKTPEKAGSYYRSYFDCQIPFLNGGLFEPPEKYDWEGEFLSLPNKLFSKDPNNPNHGDGILDIFDLYNFTVDESDFLDKEVSVDPEMLGKVFENLLEENLRKGKGTYYTPREIVNYMCKESLVNYLATESGLTSEDIKNKYFPTYNVLGDEKFEVRDVSISEQIIDILKNIKVVDPACGSGAFLVGMLQQITHLRYELETRSKLLGRRESVSSEYEIKKQSIQICIYGVDIDPGAVDIAKLRLWLSLVVDYDLEDIEPLPNLDYKIMTGNSLIEKLDTNFLAKGSDRKKNELINQLNEQKKIYFEISEPKEKSELRWQINELIRLLVNYENEKERDKIWEKILGRKNQLRMFEFNKEQQSFADLDVNTYTKKLEVLKDLGETDHFEWHLNFNEVFVKGGFDVVIGNPPYGLLNKKQNQKLSHQVSENDLKYFKDAHLYKPAQGGMLNAYRLFVCQSINLLKEKGNTSLIFPLAFMCDLSAANLRKFVLDNYKIDYLEAFPERDNEKKRVFEAVKMSVCILGASKTTIQDYSFTMRIHLDKYIEPTNKKALFTPSVINTIDPINYTIPLVNPDELKLLSKIGEESIRLIEIGKCYTGEIDLTLNKTFITDNIDDAILIKGAQVQKYKLSKVMSQGEIMYLNEEMYYKSTKGDKSTHNKLRRIVMQGITGVNEKTRLKMTIINPPTYCANSVNYLILKEADISLESLLGLLNSKLLNWYFKKMSTNSNVNGYEVDNLPIVKNFKFLGKKISPLVEKIISLPEEQINKSYELEIDQLVYGFYGLNAEEITIVESSL